MRQRGRLSLAAVSTTPVERVERLPPPADLTQDQAREWIEVVNTMPADHFMRGNQGVLEQYCRHMVVARRIAKMIDQAEHAPKARTAKLRHMQARMLLHLYRQQTEETRSIKVLLTAMRLTQQSVMRHETTRHPKGPTAKPWEDGDAD